MSAQTNRPNSSLTIVIPLYQEEAGVPALAERLRAFLETVGSRRAIDLVLVDDGSTDRTHELLRTHFAGLPCKILHSQANEGLTAALMSGSAAATGAMVGWLDSDLTYEPMVLAELCRLIEAGAEIALASCHHPDGRVSGVPRWRLCLSRRVCGVWRLVTRSRLHTFTCMVRVHRPDVIAACLPRRGGFVGVTETLLRALRQGRRIAEHPALLERRRRGQSKMRLLSVAFGRLGLVFAWWFRRL